MPAIIGELVAKITSNTTEFDKGINKAGTTLNQFEERLKKTGNQAREFGQRLSIVTSAPILGLFITSLNKLKQSGDPANATLKELDKSIGSLQMEVAKALLPVIKIASDAIKGFADWFASLDQGTKETIVTVGLLVAAIGPLVAIIGTFMSMGVIGLFVGIATAVIGVSVAIANAAAQQTKYNETLSDGYEKGQALKKSLKEIKDETKLFADRLSEVSTVSLKKQLEQTNADIQAQINFIKKLREEDRKSGRADDSIKTTIAGNSLNAMYARQAELLKEIRDREKEIADQEKEAADKAKEKEQLELDRVNKRQAGLVNEAMRVQELAQFMLDTKNAAEDANTAYLEEQLNKRKEMYRAFAEHTLSIVAPVFSSLGAAIVATGEESARAWENVKKSALNAIASVVEGYAKQWALEGAALLLNPATTVNAIGLFAASAAAFIGAGAIRGLKDGGLIMPTPGGSIVRIAEAGVPEYAVPERKDYLTRLADRITDNMSNMKIQNNIDNQFSPKLSIKINERELFTLITEASRDGRIIIDPKKGIAKR